MRQNSFLAAFVLGLVLCIGFAGTAIADGAGGGGKGDPTIPVLPIFESNGGVSFDNGYGSWNLLQYDWGAQINANASTTARVIRTYSSIYVDKYNPARISFNASMAMLDDAVPTGNLDFYQHSSNDDSNSSLHVYDNWTQTWNGHYSPITGEPVYDYQSQSDFYFDLNVPANINQMDVNAGRWTEGWGDEDGNIHITRSGEQVSFYGYGTIIGDDPVSIGQQMVASGMASYSTVPEPASLSILVLSGLSLLARRRHSK